MNRIIAFTLALLFLFPLVATAEDGGAITCYVFSETKSAPLSGIEVFIEKLDSGVTNANGAVTLKTPSGRHHVIISTPGSVDYRIANIDVLSGEVTELIVTLRNNSESQVDIEVAAHKLLATPKAEIDSNAPKGIISGQVSAVEDNSPVAEARIFVKGFGYETRSDDTGQFSVEIPEGEYTLSIIHPKFSSQTVASVLVKPESKTLVSVALTPSSVTLSDYVVTAPHIEGGIAAMAAERRDSANVADVIGAEQMSKAGDSSAAGALRRVTGLTVVGGKYVYVRGMGERYSSTLLNGATLPSPEPERRVVPLDMFPVGILESVVIQKTYSSDLPAEFGGGAILLKTRGRPEDFILSASFSMGFNLDTTFRQGLTYPGGSFDWLGIDDGSRALPSATQEASNNEPLHEKDRFSERGFTSAELESFGESMPNVWTPARTTVPPDFGFSLTVGDTYAIADAPIGFLTSISYDSGWDLENIHRNYYLVSNDGNLELSHSYDFESLSNNIQLGVILDVSTTLAQNHDLKLTSLLIRTTDDEARIYSGFNRDVATSIRVTRLRWIERMLFVQQVTGTHRIPEAHDLEISWHYAFSRASRYEPDRREVRYDQEQGREDLWILSDRPEGNQRLFSDLVDHNHDAGFGFKIPYPIWLDLTATAEVGFNLVYRTRNVDTRRFKFLHKGGKSTDIDIISQTPEQIFTPENIGPDGFQFEETTRQTDNYSATGQILGGYVQTDLPLIESVHLLAGFRIEHSTQEVTTFELFNPDNEPVVATVGTTDFLPATTLTWAFFKDMQLRAGYSVTVSRPDFRELSPATFNDVTGGRQIFGNPDLNRTTIQNADLRYEWYISGSENLSFALFYKHFADPIETIVVPSAQQSITYSNAKGAQNMGLEFEFRKNFDYIAPVLEDLYLAGNVAYIWSRISLDENSGIQTNNERALQGQSPYVVNLQLGYDNEDWGTSLTVVYNVFGPRIVEVGAQGAPDVIEQSFHQLDFNASQTVGMGFSLKFKAKNLIDHEIKMTQGDKVTEAFHAGREFSIGVEWSY
jgi:outer membrane receptor protein involved in Fe transport